MEILGVIPARFGSSRFKGKVLADILGKPMIQWVYEAAGKARILDDLIIACDDERIKRVVTGFGAKAVLTSREHTSGTDRIAEAVKDVDCDIIINVQGDEPFIRPEMVDDTVRLLVDDERASVSTLAKKTEDLKEIFSPNVVKVVTDEDGFAMYFSRAPIPYCRDEWELQIKEHGAPNTDYKSTFELRTPAPERQVFYCYKHIGIYGFRKDALINFSSMKQSRLEQID